MTLRAIVADDEPLARARLRRLLGNEPGVDVIAECRDGAATVKAIRELRPDVVFLDIEMPELGGFEVLAALDQATLPAIVFVTAYDAHAIRAFDEQALDYMLKPVDAERLHRSIERVQRQPPLRTFLERIAVRSRGRIAFIATSDVICIEAAGNYARIHTSTAHHLLRDTLANLETKLDPKRFVRIHRSTIVNVGAVRELRPSVGGDAIVILAGGKELALSRTYRERAAAAGLSA